MAGDNKHKTTDQLEGLKLDLIELQSRMLYQDDTIDVLNKSLAEQQQDILELRQQLKLIQQQLREHNVLADAGPGGIEKPPHY